MIALIPGAWATAGGAVILGGGGGGGAPAAHAASHEDGGADEISVLNLSGLLADGQTPLAHAASHQNGGSDEISVAGLSGLLADNQNPVPTAGADTTALHDNVASEISAITNKAAAVAGDFLVIEDSAAANVKKHILVSALPAATPAAHAASHENGGGDEISVAGLSGLLADNQNPVPTAGADTTALHDNVASEISAITAKATPTTSDFLVIEDAADTNNKKRITIGDLPASGGGGTELDSATTSENVWCSRTLQTPTVDGANHGQVNLGSESVASHGTTGDYATIAGGLNNLVAANYASVLGGLSNDVTVGSPESVICGGTLNVIGDGVSGGTTSFIGGGNGNTISGSGDLSFIGGGTSNDISATGHRNSIVGGDQNSVTGAAFYASIGGGRLNTVAAVWDASLGGGASNTISATAGTIGGGSTNNIVTACDYGTIGGGRDNEILGTGAAPDDNTISGGNNNTINGVNTSSASIGGGINNDITSTWSTISGGRSNDITDAGSLGSVIAGGESNLISATARYNTVGGGFDQTISGTSVDCTIAGGRLHTINNGLNSTIGGGHTCTANGDYGFAVGRRAKADVSGSMVLGDSRDQDVLAADTDQLVVGMANGIRIVDTTEEDGFVTVVDEASTTDATVTTLRTISLADNTAVLITARIIGMETDGSDRNAYILNALFYRDGAGATLQGTVDRAFEVESDAAWTADISASTNDVIITVTGGAATTNVSWRTTTQVQIVS